MQSFLLVLFIMLYKVVLTFDSVVEILMCGIQMKATEKFFPVEGGSIRNVRMTTQMTVIILGQYFALVLLLCCV